jgi:hypothetical protein
MIEETAMLPLKTALPEKTENLQDTVLAFKTEGGWLSLCGALGSPRSRINV